MPVTQKMMLKYSVFILLCLSLNLCHSMRTTWANSLLAPDVKRVTIFVANNYVKITNDKGFEAKDCNRCIFALSEQDPYDRANTLYMAFNRVISGSYRSGTGVCNVNIRWECPGCDSKSKKSSYFKQYSVFIIIFL